jgi:4'-phosphopantetheinyl transferase
VFSADELAALEAAAEGERDMLFFRIWTLKEAFVKAIGTGIGYPMNTISFAFSGDEISSNADGWRFAQFIINETAVVSLCTKAEIWQQLKRIETQNKRLILNIECNAK